MRFLFFTSSSSSMSSSVRLKKLVPLNSLSASELMTIYGFPLAGVQSGFTISFHLPLSVLMSFLLEPTSPSEPMIAFAKRSNSGRLPGTISVSAVYPMATPRSSFMFRNALEILFSILGSLPSSSLNRLHCVPPVTDFIK